MKKIIVILIIMYSSFSYAVEYSIEHSKTGHAYDDQELFKDNFTMSGKTTISVNYSDRIIIDFNTIELQVKNGSNILALPSMVFELFSRGKILPKKTSHLYISPDEPNALEWTCSNQSIKGETYKNIDDGLAILVGNDKLDYDIATPMGWFVSATPFIWTLDNNIEVGDKIKIPFRQDNKSDSFSSNDRAAKMICVKKENDIVFLESNYYHEGDGSDKLLVTWYLHVVFDTKKQLPLSMSEDRFTRMFHETPIGKNVHTIRESVKCQLVE